MHIIHLNLKTTAVVMLFLHLLIRGYAQDQSLDRISYIELKTRAEFVEVDERYNAQLDTIFHTRPGFLINPEWDLDTVGGEFVIVRYPGYKRGRQVQTRDSVSPGSATSASRPVNFPITGTHGRAFNGKILRISKTEFDKLRRDTIYSLNWLSGRNYGITTGQLTIPFKLRPGTDGQKFQMTTDVTIGTYAGIRKRLSKRNPVYMTLPFTLGLSFININNNTTTVGSTETVEGVFPGWTWSTGVIFQINNFNIGLVTGRDYASQVGDDWIYHDETWYSFAIGYSFIK